MAEGKKSNTLLSLLLYTFIFVIFLAAVFATFFYLSCAPDDFGDFKYAVCEPLKDALKK